MLLSVLPVSYFTSIISGEKTIQEWAEEGAELGLDAIDISILFLTNRDRAVLSSMRKDVEQAGMSICGSSTYPDFTHPNRDERARQKSQFLTDLEDLAEVGVTIVRVTAGQAHPGMEREEGISRALEGILGSVETAKRLGIRLVFENHSRPGVWKYPDFDFPTDIFLELAKQLKTTPVRIQFDTANPIVYGDDPLTVLEPVIDQVAVVHAADTYKRGELDPSVIGEGLVPFSAVFKRLKNAGYNGWISIEEASGTGRSGVEKAVSFIRECWVSA